MEACEHFIHNFHTKRKHTTDTSTNARTALPGGWTPARGGSAEFGPCGHSRPEPRCWSDCWILLHPLPPLLWGVCRYAADLNQETSNRARIRARNLGKMRCSRFEPRFGFGILRNAPFRVAFWPFLSGISWAGGFGLPSCPDPVCFKILFEGF